MELPFEDEILNGITENRDHVGGIDADKLAERIAKTNELVQKIKLLETENEKYLNNALELSQSVQGIKALYDEERSKCENLQRENDELRKDILKTRAELAEKECELSRSNLEHEQSMAECEESSNKDTEKYLALCETVALEFVNQANLLNDNELLDKQTHRKVNNILKKLSEINLSIPILKSPKRVSRKGSVPVAQCEEVSKVDAAVGCDLLPTLEPPKQMVSRATQYVTSTTTRAASTSAFIKTRSIGTVFPEPLTVTVEEALKATVFDLPKPISPINEINFPVARSAGTQTEIFSSKSVGTCTKVRNIRKTVRQLFENDFGVPIKTESPMNSMENLNYTPLVDSKSGGNSLPVSVQLMDLWNMLGQRLFSAMRNGSALRQEQLRAVNERIDMLHLHLQMEILNCLSLITTENNFCMDNYLLGSMEEMPRKRKLSESSEASFTAGQFEAMDESMKSWKKSGEEFTSCSPERSFRENSFTPTSKNESEKFVFHQHIDRVGDQAVRDFFSMGKSSNNSTQESSVKCPDILNNSRKSVIIRTKEVKNSRINSINTLSASLDETSKPNESTEDTEMISGSFTEVSKMSDLPLINDLIETPTKETSTEIDRAKMLVEIKNPKKLTNNLTGTKEDSCEVQKSLEIKEVSNKQLKECKELSGNKEGCSRNHKEFQEITAVEIFLKMLSNSRAEKSNFKLKRLKKVKLGKNKLIIKKKIKSPEKQSYGLKNLKKSQKTFVGNVSSLPESFSTETVSNNLEAKDAILITKNQNLLNKFENRNFNLNTDTSQSGKKEKNSSGSDERKLRSDTKQISSRVKTNTELSSSADIQDQSANCEQISSSDSEEMENIFKTCILNISPISRLSESSSENEDIIRMDVENNSYEKETNGNTYEIKSPIHIWEELDTPQSPPRFENNDFNFAVTIPLERVIEHDFNYSPQSPKFERIFDVVPKTVIIPENNTIKTNLKKSSVIGRKVHSVIGKILDNFEETKNIRLMKKKVLTESPNESKELIKVRQILEHYIMNSAQSKDVAKCTLRLVKRTKNKEIICKAIIEVIEDTNDQVCNMQTPPAPPMTETHKKIIVLVHKLNFYFKEFSHNLMSLVEQRLFSFKEDKLSVEVVINHTLLYIGLADIDNSNKNPARLFIYKCLYYHNKKAIPMIYYILVSYPNVLPKQTDPHYDRSDALISTIQCILNSLIYNMEKRDLKHREVFHILRMYYEYERVKPSREEVVENLMAKIKAGKLENVSFSFALLCKHFGIEWTEREIITKYILPALTECYNFVLSSDCYDSQAATLLESLSFILKPFPLNSSITRYQQIFTNFLYATDRKIIQDAAVCAILRTQRFSYVDCFNSICNWNPNYNVDKNVRAMLNSFVYRKPFKFWKKIINQI